MNKTQQKQVDQFVDFWKSIEDKAINLMSLRHRDTGDYWSPKGLAGISKDGLEFYDLVPEQYDDGYTDQIEYLAWDDLFDYDNQVAIEESRIANQRRKQAEQASNWERDTYERLKAKFGGKPNEA